MVITALSVSSTAFAGPPLESGRSLDQQRSEGTRQIIDEVLRASDLRVEDWFRTTSDVSLGLLQDDGGAGDAMAASDLDQGAGGGNTGTDPRDFSNKFMPYYRYTELENNVEVNALTMFGLFAFNPRLALTYELPVAMKLDISDVDAFPGGFTGDIPGEGQGGGFPVNGLPSGLLNTDFDGSGDEVGMGDLILRMFGRPESLEWTFDDGSGNDLGKPKSFSIMPTIEITAPTATDDVLGGEALIVSPSVTFVTDLPGGAPFGLGFIAMMNFLDFDVYKDSGRNSTTRYRGRIFWMQPLREPGPGLFDGIYVLTEVQPIYDFMTGDFDLWVGPEFGKIVKDGFILYAKPGWGIDTEPEDRDFTFEVGVRIFY